MFVGLLREFLERLDMADKNVSALCHFLTGFGTGIALAIFFAPRSGGATRHFIGRKAQEGTDLLKAQVAAGRDYLERQAA
jgi:hypothetical protein